MLEPEAQYRLREAGREFNVSRVNEKVQQDVRDYGDAEGRAQQRTVKTLGHKQPNEHSQNGMRFMWMLSTSLVCPADAPGV